MTNTTIIGFIAAFGLLGAAIYLSGDGIAFADARSALIVLGGTMSVTLISFRLADIAETLNATLRALSGTLPDPQATALKLVRIADTTRKTGIRELERHLPQFRNEAFLSRAMTMVVEGVNAAEVERILQTELDATQSRNSQAASVLRRAAEVAPAMGLIGTLVGLVQMLGTLDDPSSIGPAMAVALLTTFYGAILGNMVLAPLAAKIERSGEEEKRLLTIYALAASAIGRQESARRLELQINSILPPAQQVHQFSL